MNAVRILVGGIVAALVWWGGMLVVFGPAQGILADPSLQSGKFLAAFTEPPYPRAAERPELLAMGLLVIAWIHSIVFSFLAPRLPGGRIRRGMVFGLLAWGLMVPWFEFYLPWNVMREPLSLVLLEALCWLAILLAVGISLSLVYGILGGNGRGST